MARALVVAATLAVAAPARADCPAGDPFTPAALRADLEVLASPALDGRAPGTAGDEAARAHIVARFTCLGLVAAGDGGGYQQAFTADGAPTANVVGYVAGTDPALARDVIVVGAHHDHLGDGLLGANDNASGVAALLAVARAVAASPPRRTVAFVTFGGEELGLLGSQHFVAHLPAALPADRIVQYVNLDMIGSYSARKKVHAFGAFAKRPARTVLASLRHPGLTVSLGGHSTRGDHASFCDLGIPYVFFWTSDPRCYHRRCDVVERVDVRHTAAIASLAGALTATLADGDTDLAAARARHGCR